MMTSPLLSKRILEYADLVAVQPGDNVDPLVEVQTYDDTIIARYSKPDMRPFVGDAIFVHDEVARRLAAANAELRLSGWRLKVVFGYRHPEVQQRYFLTHRAELREQYPEMSGDKLDILTHYFIAVPDVAGHPTAGAVDLTMVDEAGKEVDMGTDISDFSDPERIKTFAGDLTPEQQLHRSILHDALVKQGFAPFYGEWWHFSYGDREWAAFYNQPKAIYRQIDFRS